MDHRFGMAKLAAAFIAANNCASAISENGTWEEWNWELDYNSFLEASHLPKSVGDAICAYRSTLTAFTHLQISFSESGLLICGNCCLRWQVLVRIADIKSKTQEGDLAAKLDRFLIALAARRT
jgi:hypothetical protein